MPTYVSLINWTEQGVENYRDTTKRARAFGRTVQAAGGKMRNLVWTMGEYDIVAVYDAPDDESAVASLLRVSSLGNVRSRTMRGFSASEMDDIISMTD